MELAAQAHVAQGAIEWIYRKHVFPGSLNPAHALHGGVSYFAFVRPSVRLSVCVCVCGQDISKSI